ncbi:MAG: CRISPR-associated endonuclease Cas2 [Candidatus Loosdrechtia sp.]|uniref:CRISPR-associated endonuclease Cas2 n=1 Tax=Candidatus Loosdrechtia sp. TaxID=3101272 RepID=UPI003A786657|nr:MAG: CRISPR-associated endonuclease Cas2 [Candidatus Jettenia sp. AMX2]
MPYLIVTYDIGEERVNKIRKILKKYFMWVQNSVFEGDITLGKLEQCKVELRDVIETDKDSIYFYSLENRLNYRKVVLGIEKEMTGNIL